MRFKTFMEAAPDSPAFKSWFAGSKVVDKKGNPLVVFRGMAKVPAKDNFRTRQGRATLSFTSIPEIANVYAKTQGFVGAEWKAGANIGAYYLSIKNPADVRSLGARITLDQFIYKFLRGIDAFEFEQILEGLKSREEYGASVEVDLDHMPTKEPSILAIDTLDDAIDLLKDENYEKEFSMQDVSEGIEVDVYSLADSEEVVELLQDAGYDGMVIKDVGEGLIGHTEIPIDKIPGIDISDDYSYDVYRPFSMSQIKSAIGNKGTFNKDSSDVTESVSENEVAPKKVDPTELRAYIKSLLHLIDNVVVRHRIMGSTQLDKADVYGVYATELKKKLKKKYDLDLSIDEIEKMAPRLAFNVGYQDGLASDETIVVVGGVPEKKE